MSSLTAGSTLCDGRYLLEEIIGRGGMAIVWRARDLQLERDVAIKVISDVLASDPSFVARFEREARIAAALNHPNLVKVFDFSTEGERPFLVMEYVGGGTLADARSTPLDAEALAVDLLDAVAHIHAGGILHRDIKPANVLLAADGSPRLTDFGIARGDETSGLTQTGQVLGTLRYIAPEVARGEPASIQSDLYSLGVLLDEIAATAATKVELFERMRDEDPSRRPASAGEAIAELREFHITRDIAGQSETRGDLAPTVALRAPERKRFAPTRTQALAAAAALLVLLVIVVAAASGGGGDDGKTGSATQTTPKLAPASAPTPQQVQALENYVRSLN